MNNPNEYNDLDYSTASMDLDSAIQGMWEAGATIDNIEETINNGLGNAEVKATCIITPGS